MKFWLYGLPSHYLFIYQGRKPPEHFHCPQTTTSGLNLSTGYQIGQGPAWDKAKLYLTYEDEEDNERRPVVKEFSEAISPTSVPLLILLPLTFSPPPQFQLFLLSFETLGIVSL